MIALLLFACRPDPGNPQYPEMGDLPNFGGPDPYEEGEDRLTLGLFYEMESSENYIIAKGPERAVKRTLKREEKRKTKDPPNA